MEQKKQLKEKIWDYYRCSMPYCDKTDVASEILEAYAEHACWLRENVDWCRELPEDIFLEHVAAYRINNEKIEDCRKWFCELVLPCIQSMTLKDAILEANLWCSAHVTYHPADERTASALASYKGGFGRCGEESVFTVTVLRSVGIAARQVYAPLWSHCDDNHAWVEVYCDGQWHYLGACEPEAVLDRGWFDAASSRAMLIHGRSFARISSGERVISKEGCAAYYSVTDRYGETAEVTFLLSLPDGEALRKTRVELELLNYSDYGRIARLVSDEHGRISLPLGLGSVRIACAWGGDFYFSDVEITCPGELAVTLRRPEEEIWISSFFRTPKGGRQKAKAEELTAKAKEEFEKRIERAKEERRAELAACYREEVAAEFPEAADILRQAGRNFDELAAFLRKDGNPYRLRLLRALAVKDYYDVRAAILEEHLQYAMPYADRKEIPEDVFVNYVLNPRLEYEELSAYRGELTRCLGVWAAAFADKPERIWTQYCRKMEIPGEDAYDTLYKLPLSVFKDHRGSERDRNNLFVAIARSCGIPARLNPVTKRPEYYRDGSFYPANPGERASEKVRVILKAKPSESYTYPGNFSFARWETDHYHVWDLSRIMWKDGELVLKGEPGDYRIITTHRLEDGSQLAKELYFSLADRDRRIELEMPELESDRKRAVQLPEVMIKREGSADEQNPERQEIALNRLRNGKRGIYLWIREGEEPTEHLLCELLERSGEVAECREQIFVMSQKNALENGLLQRLMEASGDLKLYVVENFDQSCRVAQAMELEPSRYPLAVAVDEEGRGVYGTCGYHVGSTAMLLKRL